MFCALLTSRYQVSIYRTNGPLVLIPTPDFPHFCYMLGGNLGSLLYGDVSMMRAHIILLALSCNGLSEKIKCVVDDY